eukprot:scaffold3071_cov253-Pinguiococcus_pyrenoidosus.AAC.5
MAASEITPAAASAKLRKLGTAGLLQLTAAAAPLVALAQEMDNDEIAYGTVEAPGWVLPVVALLTISLTAAVPILLQPGDDAAREMQERDASFYGKSRRDEDDDGK